MPMDLMSSHSDTDYYSGKEPITQVYDFQIFGKRWLYVPCLFTKFMRPATQKDTQVLSMKSTDGFRPNKLMMR